VALTKEIEEQIKSFVYLKPRTVNEISQIINKNWRTALRYVEQIMLKTGTIKTRTFREGTRGALRLVYWNSAEKIYATDVQETLFKKMELGVQKSDFSPFEIFQYIDPEQRHAYYENIENEDKYDYDIKNLLPFFESTKEELVIFAGNLAFIHLKHQKKTVLSYFAACIKRGITIKIISNINFTDLQNVQQILQLNAGLATPLLQLRHAVTPLRAYIFDTSVARFGEIANSQGKPGQRAGKTAIYYELKEKSWLEWIQKLFWKKFQEAIPAKKRVDNLMVITKKRN
jgi:hypothetical protein